MDWKGFADWAKDQISDVPATQVSHPEPQSELFHHMIGNAPVVSGPPHILLADGTTIEP